ncbi:MAG: hypothetical protein AAF558_03785 [Verrucomicrobiota bacterium]
MKRVSFSGAHSQISLLEVDSNNKHNNDRVYGNLLVDLRNTPIYGSHAYVEYYSNNLQDTSAHHFSNPYNWDFRLVETSSAIGYASNETAFPNDDQQGDLRPSPDAGNVDQIDAGADQWVYIPEIDTMLGKWFAFKNKATGRYLDTQGAGLIVGSTGPGGYDRDFRLVKHTASGSYNIECRHTDRNLLDTDSNGKVKWSTYTAPSGNHDLSWNITALGYNTFLSNNRATGRHFLTADSAGKIFYGTQAQESDPWELVFRAYE